MTRPAIVIGLGGTGQQVLTFLKKELLEIGGGELPREVKLLAFDTASRVNAGGATDSEKIFRLGNVALEENTEYVCIGKDLFEVVQRIKYDQERAARGEQLEIQYLHWFPAKELLERGLARAAFNTTQGAGAYRTLGRLSLFENVYVVLGALQQAMQQLQGQVRGARSNVANSKLLEILIVGSFAGGTGAGTIVDMAWLARAQADQILKDQYALRGFFLLPTGFVAGGIGGGADQAGKEGRGFAAWHELDRAMLSGGSHNAIVYNPADPRLTIKCETAAYDVTYLIDPQRAQLPIQPPPEEGIFPAIANIMSFILDDQAGLKYTENLINILVDTRGHIPPGVYHSAIGAYTLKVPVYYTQAQFSHQLARETLKELLVPEVNPKGRVTHLSQQHNQEVGQDVTGAQLAVRFLTKDALKSGEQTLPVTKLLQLIGDHRAKNARQEPRLIAAVAPSGLTGGLLPYFNALNLITEWDPEQNKMVDKALTGELKWVVWNEVPPCRVAGDTPEQAWQRITSDAMPKSVPSVRRRRFGEESAVTSDARVKLRGEFGKELEGPKTAQLRRFRQLLLAQTLLDLNGAHPDPRIARGGKLGYVRAFYKELSDTCAYFIGFLNDVREKRHTDLRLAQQTRNAADAALKVYNAEKTHHCWLTFWDDNTHPDAHRAQRNYLRAEQRDMDRRRGDILIDVLEETVTEMRTYVDKTLEEIDNWIAHLAVGDDNFNIVGLYPRVAESLEGVKSNHDLDMRQGNPKFQTERQLAKVSQIIADHTYQSDGTMVAQSLEKIRWAGEEVADRLRLICGIDFPGDTPDAPTVYVPFRRDVQNPATHNLRLLARLTERPYQSLQQEQPLAKEIANIYPDGAALAQALHNHAEPFYRVLGGQTPPAVKQTFLRVNYENNAAAKDYFEVGFTTKFLSDNKTLGGTLSVVPSQDRFKLTLVRSDDLIPSETFDVRHACFAAYQQMFNNLTSREVHIFPAEQQAASYQRLILIKLKKPYRILRPEVAALLEDRSHFEMFFKAVAHGFIVKKTGVGDGMEHRFWGYQLPQHDEPLYLTPPRIDNTPWEHFEVIRCYLTGRDQRPGHDVYRINWRELQLALTKRERELGREQATDLYRAQQADKPNGIVHAISAEKANAMQVPAHQQAFTQQAAIANQKYDDLADVAQVVYVEAIEHLQQLAGS